MLFAEKCPDGYKRSRTSLPLSTRRTFSILFDGEIQINQKRRPGGIIRILVYQKVVNGDVPVEDASLAQGLSGASSLVCVNEIEYVA